MNFDFNILVKALVELLSALPITLSVGLLAMLIGLGFGIFIGIVRYFKLPGMEFDFKRVCIIFERHSADD